MKGYFFRINKELFSFTFINETDETHDWKDRNNWSHFPLMHRLMNFIKDRGFAIKHDEHVHKIIRKDYWYGRKGDLEFEAQRYPSGFKFEFFQNINFENVNGGRYDFDKFEKATYLIKLLWINETKKMGEFLESLGITNDSDPLLKTAEDKIKFDYVKCWHHPQRDMNFKLADLDGKTDEYSFNHTDRDGKTIYNGQIKYFYIWNTNRLMRGKVYHNINNMWWVILNDTEYTNIADFELFDPTAADFKIKRKAEDRKPKEYLEKLKSIEKLSNKELLREFRKRKLKVS